MSFMSLSSNQKFLSSEANTAKNHAPTKDTVRSTRSLVRGLHARITLIRARSRVNYPTGGKARAFLFVEKKDTKKSMFRLFGLISITVRH